MSSLIYETHTKKKSAPLNASLGILFSVDHPSFMYDLYHLSLFLLKLPHCLHPEGYVQHELNVVLYICDFHTTLICNDGKWDCDGSWNNSLEGLFDQSCILARARELDKLALTVHDSTSHTLFLLGSVTHFGISYDAATVLVVLHALVLPIAPVCKEG